MNLQKHAGRWRGRTVVCIASGPSLTAEDCELVRQSGHPTVVVNTSFRRALFADILFAMDAGWWGMYLPEVEKTFKGERWGYVPVKGVIPTKGALYPTAWGNSGSFAISLAVVAKPMKIVLIGYDCQFQGSGDDERRHWHDDHPPSLGNATSFKRWPYHFELIAKYARQHGVNTVNCSRSTALSCFERGDLRTELG